MLGLGGVVSGSDSGSGVVPISRTSKAKKPRMANKTR